MAIPSTSPVLAGSRFGLTAEELAKKYGFTEDVAQGLFADLQPQTQQEPQRVRSATYKGRGNILGYNKGGTPTVTETVSGDTPLSSETPSAPSTPEEPKALKDMTAQEIFSNYSKYDQGEKGLFGGKDVDYLRKEGLGDDTIREVARLSSVDQQTPAAVYARLGGTLTSSTSPAEGPEPQQYARDYLSGAADVGEKGVFGGKDVDAMRSKGYSDEQIRATATAIRGQGQSIPDAVFRRLGNF